MATIRTFEDIEVWRKARVYSEKIYQLTLKGSFSKDYSLKDQINASSGSIMDNIAEGFGRGGTKEFIQFLCYSRGSAEESRSQLYRAFDRNHIDQETFDALKNDAIEIDKMITGFINYLQSSRMRGTKFMEPGITYFSKELQP